MEVTQLVMGTVVRVLNRGRPKETQYRAGWGYSAYTMEDLPSNWYGAGFGSRIRTYESILMGRGTPKAEDREMARMYRIVRAILPLRLLIGRVTPHGARMVRAAAEMKEGITDSFVAFLRDCGAVPLTTGKGKLIKMANGQPVKKLLEGDIAKYEDTVAKYLPFQWRPGDPKYPYAWNFSRTPKKTLSHDCVCDGNGSPIYKQ